MARKVSDADIERMVELYSQIGTYAGVAREVGFSASTVRKYIIAANEQKPPEVKVENKFDSAVVKHFEVSKEIFMGGKLLCLTDEERRGIQELWKEMGR